VDAGAGADTIVGGSGADTIAGGTGADSILTGAGNDLIYSSDGADTIDGGGWWDIVTYEGSSTAVTIDFSDSLAEVGGEAEGDVLSNIDYVIGSDHDDVFTSSASGSTFNGMAGDDTFTYHRRRSRL